MTFSVRDPGDAPSLLLVVPIAILAVAFGPLAGSVTAAAALALFSVDVAVDGHEVGVLAYVTRGIAFLLLGTGLGMASRRLRARDERMRAILATSHEAFISMDERGVITDWNPAAEEMFGWPARDVIGRRVGDTIVPPSLRARHEDGLREYLATGEGPVLGKLLEMPALRRSGEEFPVELSIVPARNGRGLCFHAFLRDISERKQVEREREQLFTRLEAMARTDALTGLPNRRAWDEELTREIARAERTGDDLCVAMLDIDRFKLFNDQHGHPAGDRLLREASATWRQVLRQTDLIARYGGDEFAVVLPACPLADVLAAVERLRVAVPSGQTCSVGVAAHARGETQEALMRRADIALYDAKAAGRDRVVMAPR